MTAITRPMHLTKHAAIWVFLLLGMSAVQTSRASAQPQIALNATETASMPQKTVSNSAARTMQVAQKAFEHFKHGLAKGEWQPFLDMLSDDFTFYFPTGKYQGQNVGKERAAEFFRYVSTVFPEGVRITEVLRVTGNERTVVFEFKDEGTLRGEPYKNRVAVSLDVCGDKICAYREYFGSDGKSN